jgi:excisionase family DNA binding protein
LHALACFGNIIYMNALSALTTETQPLLDVRRAAELLNVSPRTVYALVERNEVPHARVGGQIRFVPSALEQWLREGGKRAP